MGVRVRHNITLVSESYDDSIRIRGLIEALYKIAEREPGVFTRLVLGPPKIDTRYRGWKRQEAQVSIKEEM